MKNIIYSLLMLVAVGMTFSSCSEDRDSNPTFNPNDVKSFTLNMPGYALNNAYDLEHSEYLVLTTSQPDYGFPVSTVYTVWVSLDNEHFENLATTSTNTYISVPASELNEKILTMAGDKDLSKPIPLYVYLTAHVYGNETLGEAQSNTITLPKVQAYVPVVEIALPQMMYIVGSFPASDGWSKFVPLSQAFSQDGFYYGVVYLPSGSEFKINQDAGWKGNDKGYGQLTVTDDAGAGLSSADASNDAANIKVANGGWYNIIVKGKIANGALQYELITRKADVYIIGAALGGEWSLSDNGKFTAPANEGAWTSPAFTGDGELRMFVDCGIDWWKTEFTIKNDGTLFYRNVDIPNNWAESIGADYSCQVSTGQKAVVDFTQGTGRVE